MNMTMFEVINYDYLSNSYLSIFVCNKLVKIDIDYAMTLRSNINIKYFANWKNIYIKYIPHNRKVVM